ncbi:hypothetical protein BKA93DRAFT_559698 [Sparassis latifolia]
MSALGRTHTDEGTHLFLAAVLVRFFGCREGIGVTSSKSLSISFFGVRATATAFLVFSALHEHFISTTLIFHHDVTYTERLGMTRAGGVASVCSSDSSSERERRRLLSNGSESALHPSNHVKRSVYSLQFTLTTGFAGMRRSSAPKNDNVSKSRSMWKLGQGI